MIRALVCVAMAASSASGQLRLATWNVTNYSGGRTAEFQTSIYGEYEGRSMRPDVLVIQEILSQSAVDAFKALLNAAPGSPGDWQAGPFVNGPDTDSAFFYRASKVEFVGHKTVAVGGTAPNHPRNIERYDWRPVGYPSQTVSVYSSHMKSGTTTSDVARRLLEAQRIRADAQGLGRAFFVVGDFNMRRSGEGAYQELVASKPDNAGRSFDPISSPGVGSGGEWYQQFSMRFVHTQAPGGTDPNVTGGMDDRHDQILASAALLDGQGFDYLGLYGVAYSLSTWNDPNHTYRAWGNDGTSFNQPLTVEGNTMVGAVIAQALKTAGTSGGGHLPVFLDLQVPARVEAPVFLDFGQVAQGSPAESILTIANAGDVARWTPGGIDELDYVLAASEGFGVEGGAFEAFAGSPGNAHVVSMETGTPGVFLGTVTIVSDDPEQPVWVVDLMGEVVVGCAADCEGDGDLDVFDFLCFQNLFAIEDPYADWEGDGDWDVFDFLAYQNAYATGC